MIAFRDPDNVQLELFCWAGFMTRVGSGTNAGAGRTMARMCEEPREGQ